MARHEVKDLFAFWAYDLFPYVLGAPVEYMDDNGNVRPKGYGGYWFKPLRIVPLEAGQELHEQLKAMESKGKREMGKLADDWQERVYKLFPEGRK